MGTGGTGGGGYWVWSGHARGLVWSGLVWSGLVWSGLAGLVWSVFYTPPPSTSFPRLVAYRVPQRCNLDGISMNIQEENSTLYFRVQSEREQTFSEVLIRSEVVGVAKVENN